MLTAGKNHSVRFKVNVMGTSSEPKVRFVLGTSPELSFPASKEGDDWVTNVNVPKHIEAGSYPMRVEVHLNNRLFTPITKDIEVHAAEVEVPPVAAPVPEPVPAPPPEQTLPSKPVITVPAAELKPEPIQTVKPAPMMKDITKSDEPRPTKKEVVMPKVVAKMPKILKKSEKAAEPVKAEPMDLESLSRLQKVAKKKVYRSVVTPLPKATDEAAPTISVSFKDVSELASSIRSTVSERVEAAAPVVKYSKSRTKLPVKLVKLVKEELFYA